MSGLVVDFEKCIGCARCVRACGNAGIEVEGPRGARKARVTDDCILCGACVDACPVDALSIERGDAPCAQDLGAYRDYWVFVQVDEDGRPLDVAFELVGKARGLADERGCRVVALLAESASEDEATEAGSLPAGIAGVEGRRDTAELLIAAGADEVIRCRDARFAGLDAEVHAEWICALVRERKPEALLYGATVFGRELAPAVAVRLQTGLTADCTVLEVDPKTGLLQQTRPAFGGNLMATIMCPAHRPQMATVRPGIFAAPEPDSTRSGSVSDVSLDPSVRPRVRLLGVERASAADSITDTDVLVVVGRGMGSKKNLGIARELAEALGGKLGCTRPIVEAGWCEPWQQVGQTGVSVAPRLLISLGVSGAIQHVAGISGAQAIIAVNEDPDAPIFASAQYKVVGDCVKVAEELLARL